MAEDIVLAGHIQAVRVQDILAVLEEHILAVLEEDILAVLEEDILVVLGEDTLVDPEVDIDQVVDILVGPVEDTQVVLEVGKHRHSDRSILVD